MVIILDESSKSPLLDGGGQTVDDNQQVGGNGVAIEEACNEQANNDIVVRFDEE
jgi:hypothetical protein